MKSLSRLAIMVAVIISYNNLILAESRVQVEDKPIVDSMLDSGELSEVREEPSNRYERYQQKRRSSKQPTTYVEASPLEESQAERLRRARQDAEIGTERKIVEKLEASRLADERKRADKLFGNQMNNLSTQQPAPQPVQQTQQVQQVPMVQIVAEPSDYEKENNEMKDEIVSAVRAEIKASQEDEMEAVVEDTYYVTGLVGSSEYPGATDVKSNSSTGILVGVETGDNLIIEGGFIYSSYYLDQYYSYYRDLDQYNFTVGAKYSFLKGRVSPTVGALVSYTTRSYDKVYRNDYRYDDKEKTTAFDVGFSAGVDLKVSDGFAVGVDFKYFTNVTQKTSDNYWNSDGNYKVEDFDYYVFNINGKIFF
ncbi:MAG: porin family protein [Bdellovibrionaceae bacterium]|jgi:hypothetical protein|nr:porin family protein [Pseudobdellovibrionaceae bacterium]